MELIVRIAANALIRTAGYTFFNLFAAPMIVAPRVMMSSTNMISCGSDSNFWTPTLRLCLGSLTELIYECSFCSLIVWPIKFTKFCNTNYLKSLELFTLFWRILYCIPILPISMYILSFNAYYKMDVIKFVAVCITVLTSTSVFFSSTNANFNNVTY